MSKLITLSGLPGSGKTSFAIRWLAEDPESRVRINYDELRIELYGEGWKFNREQENKMKAIAIERAEAALKAEKDVIIDNTNLTSSARRLWENLAKSLRVDYENIEIDTPVAECVRRDSLRSGIANVGRAVIERMALFTGWIDWEDRTLYPRDFIIVDMDGTLADCEWRRKWLVPDCICGAKGPTYIHIGGCSEKPKKNHDKFFEGVENDPEITSISNLVTILSDTYDVLVVSGRPLDRAGKGTEVWLNRDTIPPVRHLFMRNQGDHRDDFIIKREIADLLPLSRIKYVLDDRNQVVKMWRSLGLTVLQVADGDF